MAAEYIHVKIGLVDAVYPVLEFITTGSFKDFYHFRTSPTTTAWTHKQWCTPCTADGTPIGTVPCHGLQAVDSTTTDWRAFLKTHWDTENSCCKVEYLDEFYDIFRRAAAAYINKQNHEQDNKTINEDHLQHGEYDTRGTNEVSNPSGGRGPALSMPTRDKEPVRETGKQMKPVPCAATEQQPQQKKPRYVELSLFD